MKSYIERQRATQLEDSMDIEELALHAAELEGKLNRIRNALQDILMLDPEYSDSAFYANKIAGDALCLSFKEEA